MSDAPAGLPPGWPTEEQRSRVTARARALRNRRLMIRTTTVAVIVVLLGGAVAALSLRDDDAPITIVTRPTTTTTAPAVSSAPVPEGWRIVDFGDARLAVPPSWTVSYLASPIADCSLTYLQGRDAVVLLSPPSACPSIVVGAISPGEVATRPALTIHGIKLYLVERTSFSNRYAVPNLGVTLEARRGELARQVLGTLTSSARRVVLATGPAPVVPDDWRTVEYGGITLRVPPTMAVKRLGAHNIPPGACSPQTFSQPRVFLGNGLRAPLGCPPSLALGHVPLPTDGVWIEHTPRGGPPPLGPPSSQFVDVVDVPGLRLGIYDATSDPTLRIEPQGSDGGWKSIIHLGLGPDPMIARTILYSIRAAN